MQIKTIDIVSGRLSTTAHTQTFSFHKITNRLLLFYARRSVENFFLMYHLFRIVIYLPIGNSLKITAISNFWEVIFRSFLSDKNILSSWITKWMLVNILYWTQMMHFTVQTYYWNAFPFGTCDACAISRLMQRGSLMSDLNPIPAECTFLVRNRIWIRFHVEIRLCSEDSVLDPIHCSREE